MKKAISFICIAMFVVMLLPLTAGAVGAPYQGDQTFKLQNKSPTIDGKIDANEGWSNKGIFDETHTGRFLAQLPLTSVGEFYFAYDNQGLYFAYTMKEYGAAYTVRFYEPKWSDPEGRLLDENVGGMNYPDANAGSYNETNYPDKTADGIEIEGALMPPSFEEIAKKDPSKEHITCAYWTSNDGNNNVYSTGAYWGDYGWDGDVFALSFDPCGDFRKVCSYRGNYDKAPQFNVGIFEGNIVKVCTSRYSNKELTGAKGAGSIKGDTITFEVMIPWIAIVEECNACARSIGVNRTYTVNDMISNATHRAAVTHMDRYDNPEAGYVDDWGRCITVCGITDNGEFGKETSGDGIKSMGLTLVMQGGGGGYVGPTVGGFTDLPANTWYTDAALWCCDNGYMSGTSKTTFAPNLSLTRAQFVQILAKLDGVNLTRYGNNQRFKDVPLGKWYSSAVDWAVTYGVTGGTGNGYFSPNATVTREQISTFFYAYAQKRGCNMFSFADLNKFPDGKSVSSWARTAMSWAVTKGLISGTDKNYLMPKNVATRAQTAVMFKSFNKFLNG